MQQKAEYKRLRGLGISGQQAWRAAKVAVRFNELEAASLVRLRTHGDEDPSTCLDFDGTDAQRKAVAKRIDNEGCYGIIAEARCPGCGGWRQVDAVWGFVGDDWRDSGYDHDLMGAAVRSVDEHGEHKAA